MLRVGVLKGADSLSDLKQAWSGLAASAPTVTPFQTYEWQSAWLRSYGGAKRPWVFTFHEGSDLIGLMPMTRTVGPWRTLRPMGTGPSDYLHPLAAQGYESDVATAFAEHVAHQSQVDLVDLHQVRETNALADQGWPNRIDQATCLVLALPKTFEEYLATLGKSLRYDVRRLERDAKASGRIKIEAATAETLDSALETFFGLHKLRWRARLQPGAFTAKSRAFLADWSRAALERGWLRLSVLSFEERPIGALYSMTLGDATYYYQAGFDPAYGSISPGTLLVADSIRNAIERGCKQFDFMRGDEPYKRRWKPQRALKNYRLLSPAEGLLGRCGAAWNGYGSRIELRVRARFEGRGVL